MAEITVKQAKSNKDESLVAYYTPEAAIYDKNGIRLDVKLESLDPSAMAIQLNAAQKTLSAVTEACRNQITTDQAQDRALISLICGYLFPLQPQFATIINSGETTCNVNFRIQGADYENNTTEIIDIQPDSLVITKYVNGNTEGTELYNGNEFAGSIESNIDGAVEEFKMVVTKTGRPTATVDEKRYLVCYGSDAASTMSNVLFNTLKKVQAKGLKSMPQITTKNGQYIWFVVPNELSINRVVCSGFDVPINEPIEFTIDKSENYNGTYKAYRSTNALAANVWKLMIS